MTRIQILYNTTSEYKRQEIDVLLDMPLVNGEAIRDHFDFRFSELDIKETLDVDIKTMVAHEVRRAYGYHKVPCIVEHAGLILKKYEIEGYPGGLTKPMWNTLGSEFLAGIQGAGQRCMARAVVGYCDGMSVRTFVGEAEGTLSSTLRGSRAFYWDTAFVPDEHNPDELTYAQIVEDPTLGLAHKMRISQSAKAMKAFLEHRLINEPRLWRRTY